MTDPAPLIFSGLTPEHFARLKERVRTSGIELEGTGGTASQFGVEVVWAYVAERQELRMQCARVPFFLTKEEVHARLKTMVEESRD